jgi:hypothetical protein
MSEIEALADCLRIVVDETLSQLPEETREGTRLARGTSDHRARVFRRRRGDLSAGRHRR